MYRILMVANILDRGGIETLLMNIYRNMDRNHVQFDFLTHPFSQDYVYEYEDEILTMGGKIYKAPSFSGHPFEYVRYINGFFRSHPEYRIIHAHNLDSAAMVYMRVAKRHGCYIISHAHNEDDNGSAVRKAFVRLARRSVRTIPDSYFACSKEAVVWAFGRSVLESENYRIINNGIIVDDYRYDEPTHKALKHSITRSEDCVLLCNVGRLSAEKNQTFLLDVFYELKKIHAQAFLIILGKGSLESVLLNKISSLGLDDSVFLLGSVPDVNKYLLASDVFVFPSKNEGLGMAAIEAQTSGLPTIMADTVPKLTGCTDLARYLSLSQEPSVWAEAIYSEYLGQQGARCDRIQMVREAGFDIAEIANGLTSYYDSIMATFDHPLDF